jgi:hypothetical protein
LLEKHRIAAIVVAFVGAWISFWFNQLDARTRQLVSAGETALNVSGARLADLANIPSLKIVEAVEQPAL